MMTKSLILILLSLLLAEAGSARERIRSASEMISSAKAIAVVRLKESVEPGEKVECDVLSEVRGDLGKTVILIYPHRKIDAATPYVTPQKNTIALVFLEGVDAQGISKVSFDHQGVREMDIEDVARVAELFRQFLEWEKLDQKKRHSLIRALLEGPEVLQRICLEWLLVDRKLDVSKSDEMSDEIALGLLRAKVAKAERVRKDAVLALAMAAKTRKDLIPYLVDALDDPGTRQIAVDWLDGTRSIGPGPVLDPAASLEKKIAMLKKWWAERGSKDPQFKRFMPKKLIP